MSGAANSAAGAPAARPGGLRRAGIPLRRQSAEVRSTRSRRAVFALLLAVLVACGLWAAAWGGAAVLAIYGDLWTADSARRLDAGAGEVALRAYARAARLAPANADYLEGQGRILERLSQGYPPWGAQAAALLGEALARYREAAAERPTWPYVLAAIGRVKLKLGNPDEEFVRSLRRAAELGGWSPRVQLELLETALASWAILDAQTRTLLLGVLARALRLQPIRAMDLALRLGRGGLVDTLIVGDERMQKLFTDRRKVADAQRRG